MAREQRKQAIQDLSKGNTGRLTAQEWILEAYISLLLAVFPFYNTDRYFSILSDRAWFFRTVTFVMAGALLIERLICGLLHDGRKKAGVPGGSGYNFRKIPLAYLLLMAFLFVSAASTALSEYPTEAWSGEAGRLQGLSMWILYVITFFCTARCFTLKRRHLCLFFASGAVTAAWGICDYMGPGLSWWLADVKETQREMFTSSIGNINTYTAFISICFGLSGAYILHEKQAGKKAWAAMAFAFFLFSVALITGRSDNAVVGVAAFFLAAPFTLGNTRQMWRYLTLLGLFIIALPFTGILSQYTTNPYISGKEGMLLIVSMKGGTAPYMAILGCSLISIVLSLWFKERPVRRFKKVWAVFLAVSAAVFATVFIRVNFLGGAGQYGAVGEYMKFNDNWGTYRGLCWRLAYESYGRFPLIKKLAGSGPETFGIIMEQEHYQVMVSGCGQIFDSPHNEPIQHLFCTGILGAVCYYGFLASCFVKGIRQNAAQKAAAMAILVYTAVSLVNISVPITQPYLILLAAWCSGTESSTSQEGKGAANVKK